MMGLLDKVKKVLGSKKEDFESQNGVNKEITDEPTFTKSIENDNGNFNDNEEIQSNDSETHTNDKIDKPESIESLENDDESLNDNEEIQSSNSEEIPANDEITDKSTPTEKIRNFKYLDELIHSGTKEIVLDSDIVLGDGEESQYLKGIRLDVDDLTIDGKGYTIDACRKVRIFHSTKDNITVKNITLKNGYQSLGGAIYNDEGCLNIIKSVFSKNRVKEHGCAIYNNGGKVTLDDVEFVDNIRFYPILPPTGDDIYNRGDLIIMGKYSSDKFKSIYNRGYVSVSLAYVDKIRNLTSMAELNLQMENFEGSDYLNSLIHGGDCEIVLDSDIVMDNLKEIELDMDNLVIDGKGHYIDAKGSQIFRNDRKGIVLKNITLINAENSAIVNNGEMTLYDCNLINNKNYHGNFRDCQSSQIYKYVFGGGAVFNRGRMNFINCTLSDNMVYNDIDFTVGAGGAIFNLNGEIKLTNCILSDNIATENDEDAGINECMAYGGAILSLNGKIDITDSEFTRNYAYLGGGIYGISTEISMANTRFRANGSDDDLGGALYIKKSKTGITESEFDSNTAYDGGAICVNEGEMAIYNSIFKKNHANVYDGEGGAIDAFRCKLTIDGGEFLDNVAGYGGAIRLFDCDGDLNSVYYGNEARRWNAIEDSDVVGWSMNNFDEEM